jgi:hypothetical protein
MKRMIWNWMSYNIIASFFAAPFFLCASSLAQSAGVSEAHLKEFNDRVKKYVELHKRVKASLPPMKTTPDPTKIAVHEAAMDAALREARAGAQQGDIFIPAIQPYFIQLVRGELKGAAGAQAREMIKDGNPKLEGDPAKISVKVNGMYPGDAPLSTVPPDLLRKLPQLPPELEYRFVGRHLILRDVAANLIVDYILNAAPQG